MLLVLISVFIVGVVAIFYYYETYRLCYVRWQRIIHYEFWPTTVFYLPVFIYYLYLCLPYRRFGMLSLVNPVAIKEGMYQAPKVKILQCLARDSISVQFVASCESLPYRRYTEWLSIIKKFMKHKRLLFPIVLKPQIGQRGTGVHIVKDMEDLKKKLNNMRAPQEDYMVQEYASGPEYGILYARLPQAKHGEITSIVYKEPVFVTGDGKKTLKKLILAHPRACLMQHIYRSLYKERLNEVLGEGESFRLSTLGTHSRGAIFRDANHLYSKKLLKTIEKISKNYSDFYLGRYDLLAKSENDLRNGRNFKIVELNSVMGEPGHAYSPGNSLLKAYSILFDHCRLAMRIAAANFSLGMEPLSLREFILVSRNAYKDLL